MVLFEVPSRRSRVDMCGLASSGYLQGKEGEAS